MRGWSSIPCSIYRGGTSKGLFFRKNDLPADPLIRDRILLYIFGSPDSKQINGLGGGAPTTSKLAIVERSQRTDADIEYTFGQVSLTRPVIDYKPNCGNILSAVGPYAVQKGMVDARGDAVTVRIYNTNTHSHILAHFPVCEGEFDPNGSTSIPGVLGTASEIVLKFQNVGGEVTGRLLPTGRPIDQIRLENGRKFNVTVVDAGNLYVFMDLGELGISVSEEMVLGAAIRDSVLKTAELVRMHVGKRLGLYKPEEVITPGTHALPKIALVDHPSTYKGLNGRVVSATEMNILAQAITMGQLHPAYPVTGAIALAAASRIPNTIVSEKVHNVSSRGSLLHIGHPSGIFPVIAERDYNDPSQGISVSLVRTARPILDGEAWFPENLLH